MGRVPAGSQEGLCWPPLSPPLAFIYFSSSQDSTAVVAAPGHCPALCGWVGTGRGEGPSGAETEPPPPVRPSPQNARLSTARPASATTSAPSVRRACTCIKAAATPPVPRALRLQTAPWSAAALVSRQGLGQKRGGPPQRAWAGLCAVAHDDHPPEFLWGLLCSLDFKDASGLGLRPRPSGKGSLGRTWGQVRSRDPFLPLLPSPPASTM